MEQIQAILNKTANLGHQIGFCDTKGTVLASNNQEEIGTVDTVARSFMKSPDHRSIFGDRSYVKIFHERQISMIAYIDGTDKVVVNYLDLLIGWVTSAVHERNNAAEFETFLKNVLLENELPGDIPIKAREYNIPNNLRRQCYLIHITGGSLLKVKNILQHVIDDSFEHNFIPMDEENFVLILSVEGQEHRNNVPNYPELILETLEDSLGTRVHLGVGMPVDVLKDIPKSYREASLALTVGKIFTDDSRIMRYNRLGLGRLIYQLPPTLCQMFLSEVFAANAYEELDEETLLTIQKFFENNLNGSETSRQLFVHRNTLVYRLDKVQKITGLDLRNFDDAVLFKLASMVRKYLESLHRDTQAFRR